MSGVEATPYFNTIDVAEIETKMTSPAGKGHKLSTIEVFIAGRLRRRQSDDLSDAL
ncbi:hypothetical protein HZB60_03675 [candidate division KSB1 bacterium]|nr:hypothetical protein [candidate division KSB1 bacterium]